MLSILGCGPAGETTLTDPSLPLSGQDVGRRWKGVIEEATSGNLSLTSRIAVRFVQPLPGITGGTAASSDLFAFDPAIRGAISWMDTRTIICEPYEPLKPKTTYHATLNLSRVSSSLSRMAPFSFSFTTPGNELVAQEVSFLPVKPGDPTRVTLNLTLTFVHPVPLDVLKASVQPSCDWKQEGTRPVYRGKTAEIRRGDKSQSLKVIVPGDPLELIQTVEKTFTLEPVQAMAVRSWSTLEEEGQMGVQAHFTEPLKETADYTAYISVTPNLPLKVTARGTMILITGPFEREKDYSLEILPGIANIWGGSTTEGVTKLIRFEDMKPDVAFTSRGVYLTSSAKERLSFKTMNLNRLQLEVYRVFPDNIGQFLQVNDLEDRTESFYELSRVGDVVVSKKLNIQNQKNTWQKHDLDLEPLFTGLGRGTFIVSLSFTREDTDYDCSGWDRNRYDYRYYYEHPCSGGYYYRHGRVTKPVLVSDIGLMAVRDRQSLLIYSTNLLTGKPEPDVSLTMYSYQNQVMERTRTDAKGEAVMKPSGHLLVGEKDGQNVLLKFSSDGLSLDDFPIEGVRTSTSGGLRAFVYTDRGVYRPGDTIHLAAMVREGVDQVPVDLPLTLILSNPIQQKVQEVTSKTGMEGIHVFHLETGLDAPTGLWRADLKVGTTRVAQQNLRVETVAPPKIKVTLTTDKDAYSLTGEPIPVQIGADYLFGAPGAGLSYSARAEVRSRPFDLEDYRGFTFTHEGRAFSPTREDLGEGTLDGEGRAQVTCIPEVLEDVPSSLSLTFRADVLERGGRPVSQSRTVTLNPYPAYVGLHQPAADWIKTGELLTTSVVLANPDGKLAKGKKLKVNLYYNERYWWWEYDSAADYHLRYKDDVSTRLASSFDVVSGTEPVPVSVKLEEPGEYLLEVVDPQGGHAAGFFLRGSAWAFDPSNMRGGTTLKMEADQSLYRPGDTAHVKFQTPSEGSLYVCVVKGDTRLSSLRKDMKSDETTVDLPIRVDMVPNVYVFAEAVQPHAQTVNDRPLRTYGVMPLRVEEPSTRFDLHIKAPEVIRPNTTLKVEIQSEDRKSAVVTVAVVDEGLLSLTNFTTPDPWEYYYRKLGLDISFFDIFDKVIGAAWGPTIQTFRVGGGLSEGQARQAIPVKVRRFPPLSLFKGPVRLDREGKASLTFDLPNYMGQVRVMVVGARSRAYGSAEKSIRVKDDLVILPTLPRVLGPGESFTLPVTVFATRDGVGEVKVSLSDLKGMKPKEGKAKTLNLPRTGDGDIAFLMNVDSAVGPAKVTVTATGGGVTVHETVEIAVRPVHPAVTESREVVLEPNATVEIAIPQMGLAGTRSAQVKIWSSKPAYIGRHLSWLIAYPYGCIEQTVSTVFPQLYLKDILSAAPDVKDKMWLERTIDDRINAGIHRLSRFMLPEGSFSYWPGERSSASMWSNLYAGHFLVEARRLGYPVPSMLDTWLTHETGLNPTVGDSWRINVYRQYILALAGQPNLSALNLIRENHWKELSNQDRWMLAGAYQLSGAREIAEDLRKSLTLAIDRDKTTWRSCFGSAVGDQGLLLTMVVLFHEEAKASELYDLINQELKASSWLSTHGLSWGLMGMGKYIADHKPGTREMRGQVLFEDDTRIGFSSDHYVLTLPATDRIGQTLRVKSQCENSLFVEVVYQGIPEKSDLPAESRGMVLEREFLSEDGQKIDPAALSQGVTFYAHIILKPQADLDYVAVTQIFPSGWEISNTRLTGEAAPAWAEAFPGNTDLSYMDIRDDRVSWFMDRTHGTRTYHFLVRLSTVTKGTFTFPPTYAETMYDHGFYARIPNPEVVVR